MRYIILGLIAFFSYSLFSPASPEALAFINSLSKEQRSKVVFPFEHEKRSDWHFLPVGSYPRTGVQIKDLNEIQRKHLHQLLSSVLSKKGHEKVLTIIDLEKILQIKENNYTHRTPDQYTIAFFGHPAEDDTYSWSFGGHHISLHFTYVNGQSVLTPRFLGANPGHVLEGEHKGLRVLAAEEDLGFSLINSLSEDQRSKAIFSTKAPYEIYTSNSAKAERLEDVGIGEDDLSEDQKNRLHNIINEYLSTLPTEVAEKRKAILKNESKKFAWAGALKAGSGHYYRIQGETFLIEFDNVQNNANHVHTVWRDFDGDFGRDLIREHREAHDH